MEKEKELVISVIFDGHDGERYKIPICKHDIEKITLLDCVDIDCLYHGIQCENCIFYKGKTFRKGELELIVEDLEEIKDLEEDTMRFILFNDKEGKPHLLPYLSIIIAKYEELEVKCVNINCIHNYELNCRKCPLMNHGKLSPGEFKILKPKAKGSEEK